MGAQTSLVVIDARFLEGFHRFDEQELEGEQDGDVEKIGALQDADEMREVPKESWPFWLDTAQLCLKEDLLL